MLMRGPRGHEKLLAPQREELKLRK